MKSIFFVICVLFVSHTVAQVPAKDTYPWEYMIETALSKGIKVILCTPTPDQSVDIPDDSLPLALHAAQIRKLAEKYAVGLADLYLVFQERVRRGDALASYMSQINHPNAVGHMLAATEIAGWLVVDSAEDALTIKEQQ